MGVAGVHRHGGRGPAVRRGVRPGADPADAPVRVVEHAAAGRRGGARGVRRGARRLHVAAAAGCGPGAVVRRQRRAGGADAPVPVRRRHTFGHRRTRVPWHRHQPRGAAGGVQCAAVRPARDVRAAVPGARSRRRHGRGRRGVRSDRGHAVHGRVGSDRVRLPCAGRRRPDHQHRRRSARCSAGPRRPRVDAAGQGTGPAAARTAPRERVAPVGLDAHRCGRVRGPRRGPGDRPAHGAAGAGPAPRRRPRAGGGVDAPVPRALGGGVPDPGAVRVRSVLGTARAVAGAAAAGRHPPAPRRAGGAGVGGRRAVGRAARGPDAAVAERTRFGCVRVRRHRAGGARGGGRARHPGPPGALLRAHRAATA